MNDRSWDANSTITKKTPRNENAVGDPKYERRIERMRKELRRFYAEQYVSPMSAPIARMLGTD